MKPLTLIATLTAKPGHGDALGKALLAIVAPSRAEPGCIDYDVHRSLAQRETWIVYENWRSKAALEEHFATPHFLNFAEQVKTLAAEPPTLHEMEMISEKAR